MEYHPGKGLFPFHTGISDGGGKDRRGQPGTGASKVFVPLGKPIFAVLAVYTIVGVWNSWFSAMLYLPHTEWQPLQMYLRRILVESKQTLTQVMDAATAKELAMRAAFQCTAEVCHDYIYDTSCVVYLSFFQKYFVKGMVLGSLKE